MKYYIPISRRLFEHPFWCEERTYSRFEAWFDMLQSARFEDTKQLIGSRLIEVKRGQLPISLRFLASRWGWSTKKVNSFLDCLIFDKMIIKETPKETGQTILTICNYDKYNGDSENRKQEKKQKGNDEETARKQQGNKCNKEKKEEIIIATPSFDGFDLDFVHPDFLGVFIGWLEYKKERKEKYKSVKSLKICYDNLVRLSGSNLSIAAEIINQSIGCNYAGIFELKKNNFENRDNETDRKLSKSDKTRNLAATIAARSEGAAGSLSDEEVLLF